MALMTMEQIFVQVRTYLEDGKGSLDAVFNSIQKSNDDERVIIAHDALMECVALPSLNKICIEDHIKSVPKSLELRGLGNKAFQKKDGNTALLLYTKSIAAAPCDYNARVCSKSKELSLAFANRSAVLFEMGEYKDCLKDISRALRFNYPEDLVHKLMERKKKCYQLLGKSSVVVQEALEDLTLEEFMPESSETEGCTSDEEFLQTNTDKTLLPEKSYGENMEIPCASNALEIKHSAEMGRHIRSTRVINPGDVLIVEEPYASILLPERYYTHCHNCLRRSPSLLPCTQCSVVMYCSESCRLKSWESCHHIECVLLPILRTLGIDKMGLLALRIIIKMTDAGKSLSNLSEEILSLKTNGLMDKRTLAFNKCGQYNSSDYSTIYHLEGNSEKRSVSDLFHRAVIAACLLDCLQGWTDFFYKCPEPEIVTRDPMTLVGGLLLRHLQNLPCNAHEVSELVLESAGSSGETIEIGAAAYSTLSLLNHSCDPNVVRHSHCGHVAVLRAIRPIAAGDQVLDNYGYHYAVHERSERRSSLESQYHFVCMCEPCVQNWPLYNNLPSTRPTYLCWNCGFLIDVVDDACVVNILTKCPKCQEANNITNLCKQLTDSSKKFDLILKQVLSGEEGDAMQDLFNHLILLDKSIKRPWKEYNDCQETIKYKLSLTAPANKHLAAKCHQMFVVT